MIFSDTKEVTVSKDADNGRYHQLRDGTPYVIRTGVDLPDLWQRTTELTSALWPSFIQGSSTAENFYDLYTRFPAYQFALLTEQGTLIAVGNSVPLAWNGKPHDLPASGWDWAFKQAFLDDGDGKTPTIQSALGITVAPNFLGRGVSQEAILAMKLLGKKAGLNTLIAPVRPNQKHLYPLIDIYDYLKWMGEDDQPFDACVRAHTTLGGRLIKPALRSLHITGSVADWEKWSGQKMPESGAYIVSNALVPVQIDVDNDLGVYLEPTVWIWHSLDGPVPERKSSRGKTAVSAPTTKSVPLTNKQPPHQAIAPAPTLSDVEKKQILVDWNDTDRVYPINTTAHELFEIQSAYSPNAIALKFKARHLTYGELNERANQLAHYLREHGVVADTLVAIYTEQSLETIISMLAVLKAGGAYVSLDPSNLPSRIAYMIDDADVSIILTQSKLKYQLPETPATIIATVINVDVWFKENPYPSENLDSISKPTDLAYVIYTLGSTGHPKGVMVEHRNIVNLIFWMKEAYPLGVNDRLLQKASCCIDVSMCEILFTLSTGATLVLAKHDGHKDAAYLAEIINQEQIATLHFDPDQLALFLQTATREQTKSLKWITCGGGPLSPDLRDNVWAKFGVPMINMYGAIETAVNVTLYHCDPDKPRDVVPIGFPTPNSQLYILDPQLNPVPAGVTGDLYIGGAQLVRGYLNQQELTAEKFIEVDSEKLAVDSDCSTFRLYKTGDLAHYANDGAIVLVGRNQFADKVRADLLDLRTQDIDYANSKHNITKPVNKQWDS